MNRIILFILSILVAETAIAQLMPQSTLFVYNPIWNNPGVTGTQEALNVTMHSRKMWLGFNGAPATNYLAVHTPLKKESFAVGLQFLNDKIGVRKSTGMMAMGAYSIKIHKGKLSFGMGAGIQSNQLRWSDIITTDNNDAAYTMGDQSYMTFLASVGAYYRDEDWTIGISIPNLLTETYNGGGTYTTHSDIKNYSYHLMCSRNIRIDDRYFIRPAAMIKYHSPYLPQLDLSMTGGMKYLEIGAGYRHNDAVSAILRVNVNSQFSIAYAFDRPTSKIKQATTGSHEFMMAYTFLYHTKAPGARFL